MNTNYEDKLEENLRLMKQLDDLKNEMKDVERQK